MRIISQNGKIDVPYDMAAFHVTGTFIRMNMIGDTGKGTVIAEYNTPNKAEKAMEMLHNAYIGTIYMQNVEMPEGGVEELKEMVKHGFGILSVIKDTDNVKFEPFNICFRFPDDDEIEV